MSYNLKCFLALGGSKPRFLFPGFSTERSNRLYTHDLDSTGQVKKFLIIEEDHFHIIHEDMQVDYALSVGDKGLFAVQGSDGEVFCGNMDDLREHFLNADYSGSALEIEAASMLGDKDRLERAMASLNWFHSDPERRWAWEKIEFEAFDVITELRREVLGEKNSNNDLEEDFKSLSLSPESPNWSKVWVKIWNEGYRRKDLIRLACWRVESGFEILPDSGAIYAFISQKGDRSDYVFRHCLTWLKSANYYLPGWTSVASNLRSEESWRASVDSVILEALRSDAESAANFSRWVRLWVFAWIRSADRNELAEIALRNFDAHPKFTRNQSQIFIYLIRDGYFDVEFMSGHLENWLSIYRSNTRDWADLWLKLVDYNETENLFRIGRSWCEELGGTMNSWMLIWNYLQFRVSVHEYVDLARNWLSRARWDLRTWPQVFCKASEKIEAASMARTFIRIGRSWQFYKSEYSVGWRDVNKAMSILEERFVIK